MAGVQLSTGGVSPYEAQVLSPLFTVIPGEIRNDIFALALLQFEDDASTYPEDSFWYRPGFCGPRRSSSALLRTCRAAYLEGQQVFLKELEFAFWFDRGPDGRSGKEACKAFFDDLTRQQSRDLQKVRFFMQMFRFESGDLLNALFRQPKFKPETLTITIRYSDWWYWESDNPLRMSEEWLRKFQGPNGLRVLRLEYETISKKKNQMMKIVERNKKWKLTVGDEGYLSADATQLVEWKWTGTSRLGGQEWQHHDGDMMDYVVVTDTWIYIEGPMPEEDAKKRQRQQRYTGLFIH